MITLICFGAYEHLDLFEGGCLQTPRYALISFLSVIKELSI